MSRNKLCIVQLAWGPCVCLNVEFSCFCTGMVSQLHLWLPLLLPSFFCGRQVSLSVSPTSLDSGWFSFQSCRALLWHLYTYLKAPGQVRRAVAVALTWPGVAHLWHQNVTSLWECRKWDLCHLLILQGKWHSVHCCNSSAAMVKLNQDKFNYIKCFINSVSIAIREIFGLS